MYIYDRVLHCSIYFSFIFVTNKRKDLTKPGVMRKRCHKKNENVTNIGRFVTNTKRNVTKITRSVTNISSVTTTNPLFSVTSLDSYIFSGYIHTSYRIIIKSYPQDKCTKTAKRGLIFVTNGYFRLGFVTFRLIFVTLIFHQNADVSMV